MLVFGIYVFINLFPIHLTSIHSESGMYGRLHPNRVVIVVGNPERMKRTDHTQQFDAEKIIYHPEYSQLKKINDIGLITIKGEIVENAFAQAVPMMDSQPNTGLECTVLGWGSLLQVSHHNKNNHT